MCDLYVCAAMIHDWELYSVHQDVDPEVAKQNTEQAYAMVTWMRALDLSPREPIATDESTEAHDREEIHSRSQNHLSANAGRNRLLLVMSRSRLCLHLCKLSSSD